jgi:CheY-like chemotaxis protein
MDPALDGARLLWVHDSSANNINEMHMLRSFGIEIVSAWSTSEAISELSEQRFDLVVSDMERDGDSSQGLRLLELMRGKGDSPELIFYVGEVDTTRGKLSGSFGIADRPDDLFHLFMDSLERNRV